MDTSSPPAPTTEARAADAVVALGASAGGLEALDRFFSTIDSDLSAAFVVIQHLAPDHKTMMDALLARHTRMPVRVAEQNQLLEAGNVYVIPSGMKMTLVDRRLTLQPRPVHGLMHPINVFFESLAHAGCDRVVGIVLSGTGSDGTEGVRALSEAGGWVLVQSPDSAAFDGMPRNALASGLAHESGTPEDLARLTAGIIREARDPELVAIAPDPVASIDDILKTVSTAIGIDLANYKSHTLIRRLERRVLATGHAGIGPYLGYLADSATEAAVLRREMMIPVTAFFRDQEAFDDLSRLVLRPALDHALSNPPALFRGWVVGCATGQEAYTLAIQLHEILRKAGRDAEIKIFATDIEPSYLDYASAGRYPARLIEHLPEDIRTRYFDQVEDGEFQVSPRLRRSIVFSQHDVLFDPPFLNLDLVTCRNMIIYLRPNAQERALRRMLFGLKAEGGLFLGSSENPGSLGPMLEALAPRNKLYRMKTRLRHLSSDDIAFSMNRRDALSARQRPAVTAEPLSNASHTLSPATSAIIDAFAPPSVVVDANREIRHVFGDVTPYLRFMPGNASLDLSQLLPQRTAAIVSTLIFSALRDRSSMKSVVLNPADDPDYAIAAPVRISLRPVRVPDQEVAVQLLVSFEAITADPQPAQEHAPGDRAALSARRAADLELELERVRATLKSTIEELGSANEELQASNEELMASNEELQSTNEELQSVNEELHTVNAEFQEKIVQLNEAYGDLESLSRAARIPLVFLDRNLCVMRYSAQATQIFRLRDQDLGRPLADITHDLELPDLEARLRTALETQDTSQSEVRSRDGRSWLVTMQPFMGKGQETSRLVLSLIDISTVQAMRHLQGIVDATPQNLAVLDMTGQITLVNEAWRRFALENGGSTTLASGERLNYLDALRRAPLTDVYTRQALEGLTRIMSGADKGFSMTYPCNSRNRKRWFLMHAAPLRDGGCVVTHLDISELGPQGAGGTAG